MTVSPFDLILRLSCVSFPSFSYLTFRLTESKRKNEKESNLNSALKELHFKLKFIIISAVEPPKYPFKLKKEKKKNSFQLLISHIQSQLDYSQRKLEKETIWLRSFFWEPFSAFRVNICNLIFSLFSFFRLCYLFYFKIVYVYTGLSWCKQRAAYFKHYHINYYIFMCSNTNWAVKDKLVFPSFFFTCLLHFLFNSFLGRETRRKKRILNIRILYYFRFWSVFSFVNFISDRSLLL